MNARSVFLLAISLLIVVLVLPSYVEKIVNQQAFFPISGMVVDPGGFGVDVEDVPLEASDGVRTHGFFFSHPTSERVFLFFHGNGGNASQRLGIAKDLYDLGASVFLLEYRGYGTSEGVPTEEGVYLDAEAASKYLSEEMGISEDNIILYGVSLGSAVAVHLAQHTAYAGVVLVSPLSSGAEVAKVMGLGYLSPFIGRYFNSLRKIRNLESPVIILHGTADEMLPVEMGKSLYEAALVEKELVLIEYAGHNNIYQVGKEDFWMPVRSFLNRVAPLS